MLYLNYFSYIPRKGCLREKTDALHRDIRNDEETVLPDFLADIIDVLNVQWLIQVDFPAHGKPCSSNHREKIIDEIKHSQEKVFNIAVGSILCPFLVGGTLAYFFSK